jgi:hypothetical protein
VTLHKILLRLKAGWPWNESKYPGYDALPDDRARELFRLKHVVLHFNKQLGAAATAIERAEHRKDDKGPPREKRVENCGKLLMLALQLADLAGVRPEELERWISKNYPRPTDIDDEVS